VEPNQKDPVAAAVFGHFEQIENTQKSRRARQFRRDVGKTNGFDRVHFNLAFLHPVAAAHSDARPHPDSDGTRDFSTPDSVAKALRKKHPVN